MVPARNSRKDTASSGIGLELARVLGSNEHPLVIVARDRQKLNEVAAQLQKEYGIPISAFAEDLSQPGAAERLWSDVSKSNMMVNILVNNAGIGIYGAFQNESLDALVRMPMLNVVALTTLT